MSNKASARRIVRKAGFEERYGSACWAVVVLARCHFAPATLRQSDLGMVLPANDLGTESVEHDKATSRDQASR